MEVDNVDPLPDEDPTLPPFFTEFFPGASSVFGQGETFMDIFDRDEHAEKRQANLYYPFASQPEWELASYLLKSNLTVSATDEFLGLQMVSLIFNVKHLWLICVSFRSKNLNYHLDLPKIFVIVPKSYQISNRNYAWLMLHTFCPVLLILN